MAVDIAKICLQGLEIARKTLETEGEEGRKNLYKPGEPLTKSDLAISQALKNFFLNSELPAIYCSEESGQLNNPDNPEYSIFWDELDGTFNYQRGGILPSTTVISAFKYAEQPKFRDVVFAGIMDLKTRDLWYAKKGKGCFFNGKKTQTSNQEYLGKDIFLMIDHGPCPSEEDMRRFLSIYNSTWAHNVSSAGFHLAGVASGHFDAFLCSIQKSHELGAGYRLIKEAGGFISDMKGNPLDEKIFHFDDKHGIIAASTEELGKSLLEKIF